MSDSMSPCGIDCEDIFLNGDTTGFPSIDPFRVAENNTVTIIKVSNIFTPRSKRSGRRIMGSEIDDKVSLQILNAVLKALHIPSFFQA
jgi:hypothetical protein